MRTLAIAVAIIVALVALTLVIAGAAFIRPAHHTSGEVPRDLRAELIAIPCLASARRSSRARAKHRRTRITYGVDEAKGVNAAFDFLHRELPNDKIGVIGVSLGAASFVLANSTTVPSAVILESMSPTIREAITDRLHHQGGTPATWLAPINMWQMFTRHGISVDIAALKSPVLVSSGDADKNTTMVETQHIYSAANDPKELWIVHDAAL